MRATRLGVERFSNDFLSWMAAADLSVSMAGYNTCMNILASGTPAIVWPFQQNREQHFRAERLQKRGLLRIVSDNDLAPDRLAGLMQQVLSGEHPGNDGIQTAGATRTAAVVEKHFRSRQTGRADVV
jgi:predicted glycosyltransferase